jgi:PAS domain S-box-containing protein
MYKNNISLTSEIDRLNLILDSTLEGWWEWDIVKHSTYHSPQWYKMLGYDTNEWPSSYNIWTELMHPEDQEHIMQKQNELMLHNDMWELEFRMKAKDGKYLWILSRGRVVQRDEKGQAEKVVGIHLDVTERKIAALREQELVKQQNLLKGIIKVSPVAFNVYDLVREKIIYSSHIGHKILGYTEEDFETFSAEFVKGILHPEDIACLEDVARKLMDNQGNEVSECSFRVKKKDGAYAWIKIIDWVSKRNKKGEAEEIIGSIQDISKYKALDDQIVKNIELLETLSYKNSHLVRGPVSTILGLTALIKAELAHSGIDPVLLTHLERTMVKLDEVVHDFSASLSKELNDTQRNY